ncbi:hypothetical protein Tco_0499396 [Tanacetum coccineum]
METKDTLSSCSYSDEQDMQQMLKQAKILKGGCLNGLSALKSNFTQILEQGITKSEFERAFSHIFDYILNKLIIHAQTIQKRLDDKKLQIQECTVQEVKALDAISEDKAKKSCMAQLVLNMDQLEKQLDKEEFQEIGSTASFKHMESVKKSIDERAQHKREYDSWVNERQIQTTEDKVDTGKVSGYSFGLTQKHWDTQLQEKGFAIATLKNELRNLTEIVGEYLVAKNRPILGKPALQPRRNQSVVRQPTAFKSERPRISKQRFASQVDVNNDLSKPVTTHYLPKEREFAIAKPHHMIAHGSYRYSSNDMDSSSRT